MDELARLINSLSALEAQRGCLHSSLRFWEWVVVGGVVIELVVVVREYWEDLHDFNRGIIHPPEKPSGVLLMLGLLGAGMVAVGIARELAFDSRIEGVETKIRGANEQMFGIVSKSANDAFGLGIDLLAKYKAAEREITVLKAEALPRRLSSKQKEIIVRRVASFTSKSILISWVNGGGEAVDFATDFNDTFNNPALGFKVEFRNGSTLEGAFPGFSPRPSLEIEAGADRKHDAGILLSALVAIGINKRDIAMTPNGNSALLALKVLSRR